MHKFWLLLVLATTSLAVGGFVSAQQESMSSSSGSVFSGGESAKCVEPTFVMRRQHMDFLLRQRDETMRHGIRTKEHSLKGCVDCHEDMKRDSRGQLRGHEGRLVRVEAPVPVDDPRDGFCQACHQYAAVNIDCFQCHLATSE
jgi:hypothetical protein